ncbi:MAG: NAD(P)-dependent oxidoreductase [Ignavibacteria bacterium]|jgi:nucleoside-diphosphate-sugar epimerase|nr:NAD(P)-dependent oxidoreductase [Ignavibacteria bacterium]
MKVLVTGATGFIGSFVAEKLLDKGYDVRCIIRKTSNLRWLEGKKYELVEASLSDIDSLKRATSGVDYIYHIAGNTSAKNLNAYIEGNCNGTINLVEAALSNAPNLQRFLYVSSQTAAGPALFANEPVTEDMPLHPITDYGKSKKAAEEALAKYIGKIPYTIVRPPAVYGPRDTEIYSIFQMIKMGLIAYIGFDKKLLSLIHVDDLSDGIIESAQSRNTIGKAYYISSDELYDWADIYALMKQSIGKKHCLSIHLPHFVVLAAGSVSGALGIFSSKPPVFNYQKAIDFIQPYWTCSTKSAAKDFGYKQKVSIQDGIANTVQWYKQMKWL